MSSCEDFRIVSQKLLAEFATAAEKSPRRRRHKNLHDADDAILRVVRVFQPDTYMQPHRHLGEAPFRLFTLLSGQVGVVFFDENGSTDGAILLKHSSGDVAVEVPGDKFFTLVCLEPHSAVLEIREGPIRKDSRERLAGFPDELEFLTQGQSSDLGKRVGALIAKWKADVLSFANQKAEESEKVL